MELRHREREAGRVSADLVQRHEAVPAVERRVLDALRVHGRGRLLEADDEGVVAALLEQQDARELLGELRCLDRRPVLGGDEPCARLDIGAVDMERRKRPRHVAAQRQVRGELFCLLGEGRPRLLQLGVGGDLVERTPLAGQLLVEARQRLLAGRVDEERRDVVQELVARRPLDRPLRAQRLAPLEDLLDPDAVDPGLAQPLEVAARVREPIRMVDPHAVDQALVRELDELRVRHLPHLGVLHPHAGELADVEEAAMRARAPVEVEELRAPEGVAPEGVLVARRHVVRDDVEHDGQSRRAERTELLLAAEILRDARRIDDVVAVCRARARLERRREVEVRNAQVAQVRDELARLAEAEPRPQLEPIRRPDALPRLADSTEHDERAALDRDDAARRVDLGARPRAPARRSRARASSDGRTRRPGA